MLEAIDKFRDVDDADLQIQCDVFHEEQHNDEEELSSMVSDCLDLNSHSELFAAIYDRVRPSAKSSLHPSSCNGK